MLDSKINTIHTPCKDCVFAVYDNNTQNDCALKYIDLYKANKIEVLEAYDQDKEFYIINGKKCIGYRENKWFKQFDLQDADLDSKIKKYHETNHLDYLLIIDLKPLDINQLDAILNQIDSCEIQPKKVVFIRYADNELKFPYTEIEKLLKNHNISYIWRVQTILDPTLSYREILHNTVTINPKIRFIVSLSAFTNDLSDVIIKTNTIVHHNLDQFEVVSNLDHSCIVFSNVSYRFEAFHKKDLLKNIDSYRIV